MATITVLNNEYVKMFFYEETGIVHHIFEETISGQHLQTALNTGIELLVEHGATKWLSDDRAIKAHSDSDMEWINSVWLPNVIAAGWKYWALVVPDDFMGRVNMNELTQSFYDRGVRIMVFTDPDTAMDWLVNVG